jgi:Flp pilus assembly protein TadD
LVTARTSGAAAAWKIVQLLPPTFAREKPAYALQLSQLAIDSGRTEAAVALLAGALGKWPTREDLRIRLAVLQMQQKQPRAVLMLMNPLQDSNDPQVLDILGWARLQTDDLKGALEVLKRAHQVQPHNPQITRHLAQALKESGDDGAATSLLRTL